MNTPKAIEVLNAIAADQERDVARWEGCEFNGRNVAEQLGEMRAGIAGIAKIVAASLETRLSS